MRKGIKKNVFWDAIAEEIFVGKIIEEEEDRFSPTFSRHKKMNRDAVIQEEEAEKNYLELEEAYKKEKRGVNADENKIIRG